MFITDTFNLIRKSLLAFHKEDEMYLAYFFGQKYNEPEVKCRIRENGSSIILRIISFFFIQ